MRRLLPWALLVAIGLGAGAGAALGSAGSPAPGPGSATPSPRQWVDALMATTKAAGTARLDYTEVTTSPHPDLRGSATGSGVANFAAGTFRVTEVQHQIEWSGVTGGQLRPTAETDKQRQIAVGPSVFLSFGPTFLPTADWLKQKYPRDESGLGLGSAVGFSDALSSLTNEFAVRSVKDLGPASVAGEPTTRYLVVSRLRPPCPQTPDWVLQNQRTTIWVDAQGRLVQVRSASYASGKVPAALLKASPQLVDRPLGPSTRVSTLRLSAFGRPVHVAAPSTVSDHGQSVALTLRCTS